MRLSYRNLPEALRPASIAEAYTAQEAYYRLAEPVYGAVGGAKTAATTKVMQRLMGIDHACGGAIFARTIIARRQRCTSRISSICASRAKSPCSLVRLGGTSARCSRSTAWAKS
jgi:hypothetical protein